MLSRFRSESEKIGLRQLFASMARQDHLTGLVNRMALFEAFAHRTNEHGEERVRDPLP